MPGGSRVSPEAVARDRDQSRLRAAARRAKKNEEDREAYLRERRLYEDKHRDHINEQWRKRYESVADSLPPFIGWDGEGYTSEDGSHHYMLFGCSRYPDEPLIGSDLGTRECLDYILYVESCHPDSVHIGFAFKYDVNMILRDLASRNLRHLADYGIVHWQGYRIAYNPGKTFTVSKGAKEARLSATIYDIWGFFLSKYTTALIKFGVASKQELASMEEGKEGRSRFTYAEIDYVKRYWQGEMKYMPMLAETLRDACYDADLRITRWYGPGAIASYIMRKHKVQDHKSKPDNVPSEVQIATQYAYAGGRFHTWRCGLYRHPIYTADINSAYIYAFGLLPSMVNGRWKRIDPCHIDRRNIARFGLYRIAYDAGYEKARRNHEMGAFEELHPLFHRDKRHGLQWPHKTEGWYWSPEARLVADNQDAHFLEAWIFDDDGNYPFAWVHEEFDKRLRLQHEGNPFEKTLKWSLAAMYGATARLIGWDKKNRLPPRSHELAWAGFITSWCRAEMYKLAYECWRRGGLVSIDTDGVTSTVPFESDWLERGIGEKLGQWKLEEYAGILYWQSGFYWLLDTDGEWSTVKTRGVKRGSIPVEVALEAIANSEPGKPPKFETEQTKFIGFKEALNRHNGMKAWRQWTVKTTVSYMGRSENSHHVPAFCIKCRKPWIDWMHVITHLPPTSSTSEKHNLPWLGEEAKMPRDDLIVAVSDERDKL
jgi:hypothetical protein